MTAPDLLALLLAVLALGVSAAAAVVCSRALVAARALARATEELEATALPALDELREAVRRADGQVDRVDDLLEVATSIGQRIDGATDATYRALTSPVIKGVALASGTRRAAGRLRRPGRRSQRERSAGRARDHRTEVR